MNRELDLIRNTIIIGMGRLLPSFVSIITLPIITGKLSKVEYGTYDIIMILVSLALPIITVQIETASFRFLIDYRNDRNKQELVISNTIIFVLVMAILGSGMISTVLIIRRIPHVFMINAYLLLDVAITTVLQIVRGLGLNKLYSLSSILRALVNLVFIVVFVEIRNGGLTGVLMAWLLSCTAGLLVLVYESRLMEYLDLKKISLSQIKEMIKYSLPMVPNQISSWILSVSDRAIITITLGIEANAVYAIANKIPSMFTMVQGVFIFAWQENASVVLNDSDASEYYSRVFEKTVGMLSCIMSILIAGTPLAFDGLIYGEYNAAYQQIPVLLMGVYFYSVSCFLGGIYVAHKNTGSVGVTTAAAAVLNAIINVALINVIGIYAASLSTMISYFILMIYRMVDLKSFQSIDYKIPVFGLQVFLLIVMSVFLWKDTVLLKRMNIVMAVGFCIIQNYRLVANMYRIRLRNWINKWK